MVLVLNSSQHSATHSITRKPNSKTHLTQDDNTSNKLHLVPRFSKTIRWHLKQSVPYRNVTHSWLNLFKGDSANCLKEKVFGGGGYRVDCSTLMNFTILKWKIRFTNSKRKIQEPFPGIPSDPGSPSRPFSPSGPGSPGGPAGPI